MDIPKAKFVSNHETELQRLIHTAKQIWSGFYIKKGFLILPYIDRDASVCFPEASIEKVSEIEKILSKIKLNFPIIYPKEVFDHVKFQSKNIDTSEFETKWGKVPNAFWQFISNFFPDKFSLISNIEVRLTSFGTISSYQFMKDDKKSLILYIRKDADISNIAEAILTSIINSYNLKYEDLWEENEYLVDSLLLHSSLNKLFPNYKSTITSLSQQNNAKSKTKSEKYIHRLGVKQTKQFSIYGKKILLNSKDINKQLTKQQYNLMSYLLLNNRYFVNNDQVGNILWNNNLDNFSIWAINKSIQRLRKKLILLGASADCLKTLKGRGYILCN